MKDAQFEKQAHTEKIGLDLDELPQLRSLGHCESEFGRWGVYSCSCPPFSDSLTICFNILVILKLTLSLSYDLYFILIKLDLG